MKKNQNNLIDRDTVQTNDFLDDYVVPFATEDFMKYIDHANEEWTKDSQYQQQSFKLAQMENFIDKMKKKAMSNGFEQVNFTVLDSDEEEKTVSAKQTMEDADSLELINATTTFINVKKFIKILRKRVKNRKRKPCAINELIHTEETYMKNIVIMIKYRSRMLDNK